MLAAPTIVKKIELMRKILILGLLVLTTVVWAQDNAEFITYNIRLNTSGDGEHAWPNRKEGVISVFRFHRADIFCVQEALPDQMDDLAAAFPHFTYEGVGRADGKREGEFSAVFFNKERFRKKDGGTFWLSETPDECSLGWDAAYKRVCSWVKLEEISSGRELSVFNTHFDHVGVEARKNSAALILRKVKEISGGKGPVILCGDFNLPPESVPIGLIKESLNDAFEVTQMPPFGSVATFHGFTSDQQPKKRIDYIFVSDHIEVKRYGAMTDSRDRKFFSDHLPVIATLDF
jgi:endonuclease/exonuclease/phosphatase family metal-dependent hydrolase